jgi:hypothetical protein
MGFADYSRIRRQTFVEWSAEPKITLPYATALSNAFNSAYALMLFDLQALWREPNPPRTFDHLTGLMSAVLAPIAELLAQTPARMHNNEPAFSGPTFVIDSSQARPQAAQALREHLRGSLQIEIPAQTIEVHQHRRRLVNVIDCANFYLA